jgi:cell division transport system permease protein
MNYSFVRAVNFAFKDFWRNIWLSLVTVTVLILAILSVNVLISLNAISDKVIGSVQEKVDISIFIKPDIEQIEVANLQSRLQKMSEVKEVIFISKNDALEDFKKKHQDEVRILEALKEVEKNPLVDSLIIKANDITEYKNILNFVNLDENQEIIKYQNYTDHEKIISRVNSISEKVEQVGIGITAIFVLISILIVFNAIRVMVYTRREEISVMRLVGASSSFIRLPFLLESILYAIFACVIAFVLLYAIFGAIGPYLSVFLESYNFNLIEYYNSNFIVIFAAELAIAAILSILSSAVAISRYLKI